MKNVRINRGGVVGGLLGVAGVTALYFMAQSNEATQQEPIRPLLVLIMLAGVTGNVIWDKVSAKLAKPETLPAAEADAVGADGVGADGVGADGVGADGVGADGVDDLAA